MGAHGHAQALRSQGLIFLVLIATTTSSTKLGLVCPSELKLAVLQLRNPFGVRMFTERLCIPNLMLRKGSSHEGGEFESGVVYRFHMCG